ncbi:MAG TPA: TetR/AcrR family transcriptional regulator [Chloroflexota bacterium]|nr:TetR/AcrR family transcriptional regulator [Chloroflexota bacterium]
MTINYEQERQSSFKERVKHEREQEILQAARDVFSERGFEKASIDEIAERVGIGKGTVYLHFPSKEELLLALMRQVCLGMVEVCRVVVADQATTAGKLHSIIRTLVDHRYANERWVRIVSTEAPAFFGHKERLGASSELRALIAQVLEEGQAEGAFDGRIKPSMAAQALLFLIFVTPSADGGETMPKEAFVATAGQLYFHGITKEAK